MYCKKCGNKFLGNEKFCAKCGNIRDTLAEKKVLEATPQDEGSMAEKNKLKGLNGWLTVVLLGLLYTLYNYASATISSSRMFTDGTVEDLSSIQGYAGALGFEVVLQFIFALMTLFLLFLFFKKKKQFPKFYIIFLIANASFVAIDTYIVASLSFPTEIKDVMKEVIEDGYTQLWQAIVSGIVWIWYMKVSRRVKLTFTE